MTVKDADSTSTGSDKAATAEPTFHRRGLMVLGAGGLLMMPSAEDFGSEIGGDIARYFQGAEGMDATERVRLVQVAVPSREGVTSYQDFRKEIEELIGRINGSYGKRPR